MNYYPHHIGDFNSATRHLTRVERSLYRDLLELYYDTEQPLPASDLSRLERRVIANTEEEKEALHYVLSEFFTLDGDVYRHARCDEEIARYHSQIEAKSKAGKASARSRQAKETASNASDDAQTKSENEQPINTCSTDVQLTKNQEPITNINNPLTPLAGGESPQKPKRERKPRIQLKTFIEQCREKGERPISEYRPLLDYVEATGLPMEFVQLAWEVFKDQFMTGGTHENRLQADWRRHFLNYVQKGYYRLWYAKTEGDATLYMLTTQGLQAQALVAHREAA